jgi:hypothetical protein
MLPSRHHHCYGAMTHRTGFLCVLRSVDDSIVVVAITTPRSALPFGKSVHQRRVDDHVDCFCAGAYRVVCGY